MAGLSPDKRAGISKKMSAEVQWNASVQLSLEGA